MEQRQIKQASDLRGLKIERALQFDRAAVDLESRTVQLAFASENPVERWYGFEILGCKPNEIRLTRLMSGGPLLLNHDPEDQVGVVESVTIGDDGMCRATVRFSRSEDGETVLNDIADGIRRNVSVGYLVHEAVMVSEKEGTCTYRITDWEPYEVSVVSMPADISVGIGRSESFMPEAPAATETNTERQGEEIMETTVDTAAAERAAVAVEQKRVADIMQAGKDYADRGGIEIAAGLVSDPKATADTVRKAILDKVTSAQAPATTREPEIRTPSVSVGLRYNPASIQAFKRFANPEAAAYRAGMWAKGILMGDQKAERWCIDNGMQTRVMVEGTNSAGGYLVPDELEGSIIDLRAQYGVCRQLARVFPMGSDTLSIPKWSAGTTAYFPSETTTTTASDATLAQVQLVAKEMSALTLMSFALAEDAVIDMAAFLANEQAYAFAVKEDQCWIDGDGTSTYGGMTGLKALLETASMAGGYTAASTTDAFSEIILGELNGTMGKLPSYANTGAVWLCSPAAKALVLQRLAYANGGNTQNTIAGAMQDTFFGKPIVTCEPCYSSTSTDYTGKAILFYGNFGQGTAFGERKGISVQVLRERYAEYRQIGILATERISIVNHGVGDTTNAGPICALIGG